MLKIYSYQGHTYQWTEGSQPQGAVEVTAKAKAEPEVKAAEPVANKAVKPAANKKKKAATK